ncbi:preprotein translocase subunit YajC [Corynebacterium sp. HMSC034E11]|uniref:preprotein translocase subunit YajC n=1 Tax=Corynebacterium sp. HMSC034E11 TaxID=1715169 RepID=UPI0008A9EA85|nr:preprotein translocase subunit YajC [Corynebacterium sp. HMSC034E11]OHO34258.1 preprotein translocase subunit YajC [Corynebacterium sp. HMSC034E11]
MEPILLIVILALFLLPSILMMRGQKKRQAQIEQLRQSIQPGDQIVNVAGFHATVVEHNGETMLVELVPGVAVTMDTAGVMRKIEPVAPVDTNEVPN